MRTVAAAVWTGIALVAMLGACSRAPEDPSAKARPDAADPERGPMVTISPDQEVSPVPSWQAPEIAIDADNLEQLKTAAAEALAAGELYGEPDDAIPLYLALRAHAPKDPEIAAGFAKALDALIARGDEALANIDQERAAIRVAHEIAAVARGIDRKSVV